MKVDFSKVLTDLSGKALTEDGTPASPLVTLRAVTVTAVLSPNIPATEIEKVERFKLATLVYASADAVPLTVEQVALIKKLIGIVYPPLIVGQSFAILEGDAA